ncbi:MAG: hypothetical protein JOZ09_09655 [Pseudonocardiales bacterium]|nr:hypothetical protein [Pseudonocardiales bacterium]
MTAVARHALCGAVAAAVVSCGAPALPPPHTPSDSVAGQIAPARNPQCATIGPQVARYLATGDNAGHPELDNSYAQDRTVILSAPVDARDGLIRAETNHATAKCDAQVDADAAAQAQAVQAQRDRAAADQAAAHAAAQAAADKTRAAATLAKEKATCAKVGGTWNADVCQISYKSPNDGQLYHYTVSFDPDGNVTPSGPPNAGACTSYYGPGSPGHWHPDTDVCSI